MPHSGILGKPVSSLDSLVLGEAHDAAAIVEATPGLVILFKCDSGLNNPIKEKFGHDGTLYHNNFTYQVNDFTPGTPPPSNGTVYDPSVEGVHPQHSFIDGRDTSYKVVDGISDFGMQMPCGAATNNGQPFADPNGQLTVKTSKPIELLGEGTMEFWFNPNEFGTERLPNGFLGQFFPRYFFDIVRLRQGGQSIVVQASNANPGNVPQFCLRWNYRKSDGTFSSGDDTNNLFFHGLQTSASPYVIQRIGVWSWYHVVLTWDRTRATAYVNGSLAWDSFEESAGAIAAPAFGVTSDYGPGIGNINGWLFEWGQCGGKYDLVAVYNRKLSGTEVASHYNAGKATTASTLDLRSTSFFSSFSSTRVRNARISKILFESLYATARNARISKQYIETLRSVNVDTAIHRNVQDTLSFTQQTTGFTRLAIEKNITQTLVLSQYATPLSSHFFSKSVTQTLNFTQTVVETQSKLFKDTLTFAETVEINLVYNRDIRQLFTPVQIVSTNNTLNIGVTQTLNFLENHNPGQIDQFFNITQSVTGYVNHDIFQTLVLTQTVAFQKNVRDRDIHSGLIFSQVAWINGPNAFDIPTDILSDGSLGNVELGITDDYGFNTNFLTFSENIVLGKVRGRKATDLLTFSQTVVVQKVFIRHVTQNLIFLDGDPANSNIVGVAGTVGGDRTITQNIGIVINGEPVVISVPAAYASVIKRGQKITIISSKKSVIVLPAPEFGDTESLGNVVNVKRSMNGKVYTYIKTAQWNRVHYDFTITQKKAFEFRQFLLDNLSEILTIQNWKGQTYVGQFLSNPSLFTYTGRYSKSNEKVTISLDFEGVRVHG